MNQQDATARIAELLELSRISTEEALNLGKEFNVPVNLNAIGIGGGEDMWYVDAASYKEEQLEEFKWSLENEYIDQEDYNNEIAALNDRIKEIQDNGGYENGYKILGWMSSSTNC